MTKPALARVETASNQDPRLAKALEKIGAILIPGERVEAWSAQFRLFALTHRRAVVVATTGRLLVMRRHLIAGYALDDVRWQDLRDARFHVGIFGADLALAVAATGDLASQASAGGRHIQVIGLEKDTAQQVYRICQAQEQTWREKRRVRDLEEMRARAGGVQLMPSGSTAGPNAQEGGSPGERLARAKAMLDQGLIADAEYEAIKAKVISAL